MGDIVPGQLTYVFGVSIFDAAFLAWLALLWYRRSVRRLMREGAPGPVAGPAGRQAVVLETSARGEPNEFSLREETLDPVVHDRLSFPRDRLRLVVLAYCFGAVSYAAVITTLKFMPESPSLPAVAWFVEWWTNTWPLIPTLVALLVLDRRLTLRLSLSYVITGAVAIAFFTVVGQLARGTFNTAPLTNVFWAMVSLAWTASIPLALVALTGWRRVRAVMPLALGATLLFGFGSMFFRELLVRALNIERLRSMFLSGSELSSPGIVQYILFMIVSLPVGWLAWRLLTLMARSFGRKRFSDIQLVIDCWWAVVAAEVTATTLSITYGFAAIVGGAAAFLAYRLAVWAVLRRATMPATTPRRLLLLRVFGYQARTESLFDRVAQAWRFRGPVQLIGGADLAMRTADPGDLLALLNGRLGELYVASSAEVGDRLRRIDLRPDPDGRFRINEVYCHDNTWRPTLEALLDASDTVLMDLRGFSTHNSGCIFELGQLVRRLASENVVLVCDKTTDLVLLRQILGNAWTAARREGHARGAAQVSIVRVERQARSELDLLMHCLVREPQSISAPA